VFRDRDEAGVALGAAVARLDLPDPVVLGLPRGGVPVAAAVAAALGAPLDVIVVRKLGVPFQPELAMGAIGEDGALVLNDDVVRLAHVSERELAQVEQHERAELERRLVGVRAVRPREPLVGRTAVLVDDGIATGATMRAAVAVARAHGATRVVVAAPVAPPDVVEMMATLADRVVCLEQPEPFWAVGSWYQRFDAVSDDEVTRLLAAARVRTHAPGDAQDPSPADPPTPAGLPTRHGPPRPEEREVSIPAGELALRGNLTVPAAARGVVVFAHGSGSSRHSPRNRWVAEQLQQADVATLLMDLLSEREASRREPVFDVELLASRLAAATAWLRTQPQTQGLPVGYFGASTGAAAALWAAAQPGAHVAAVVSRGGRPDLAAPVLGQVRTPTLLLVGGDDGVIIDLNRRAAALLTAEHRLVIVPGASHLFEEPGTLERVAEEAAEWFTRWFAGS
jgi:putative phosphoribosyl transferase